jgi:PhoH-like ATPase
VPSPKIFVLDTSVILYDSQALGSFDEHDLAIPVTVLEELDRFKKGSNVINLQARSFLRELDRLSEDADIREWLPINGQETGRFRVVSNGHAQPDACETFGASNGDHKILNAALSLSVTEPDRQVILVSKDINLRIKARSLGLEAEDYESIRIRDLRHLHTGGSEEAVDDGIIQRLYDEGSLPVEEVLDGEWPANHYFVLKGANSSALAHLNPKTGRLDKLGGRSVSGIRPRNAEQTFTLHALLNQDSPLVTVTGAAGTGKTLLALAGALAQRRSYRQIYLTRPLVPLSNKDIGYLPGDVSSKIGPFMQPLWDNLAFIKSRFGSEAREAKQIDQMVEQEKLHILPLAYIRGRSLSRIFFIVDEAQNLTPHEVKTIITRAGEGTKVVFTGDIFQIDTPYLDANSNGLSYLIDRVRGRPLYSHVNLRKGERSAVANLGSELL